MKKPALIIAALLLITAVTGCAPAASAGRAVTDVNGRTVALPETVDSIVALGAGALRLVCYAGLADRVAGVEELEAEIVVDRPYIYAHPRLAALPPIGQGGAAGSTPFEEQIVSVSPDVIFAAYETEAADELQAKTGIPVVCVLADGLFEQCTDDSLRLIGEAAGVTWRTDALIEYMHAFRSDLEARTDGLTSPTVYAGAIPFKGPHGLEGTYGQYPPFVAVNADNVADRTGRDGAMVLDLEMLIEWQPEYIFLSGNNLNLVADDMAQNPAYYSSLTAFAEGKTYSHIPYNWYGVNTELAIMDAYYIGSVLYPDAFADVDFAAKCDEIADMFLGVPLYAGLEAAGYTPRQLSWE